MITFFAQIMISTGIVIVLITLNVQTARIVDQGEDRLGLIGITIWVDAIWGCLVVGSFIYTVLDYFHLT